MWYAPTVTEGPASEPVSLAEARQWARVEAGDDDHDDVLTLLITAARAHVEQYTATSLVTQTVQVLCDSFDDFERLPIGPVASVSSVAYVDADGATQTLSTDVYEFIKADPNGVESLMQLKYGQAWPDREDGSRITVTLVVGYATLPPDLAVALRLHIAHSFANRETGPAESWSMLDALLCNHRRGV